jgi:hypothetical protein
LYVDEENGGENKRARGEEGGEWRVEAEEGTREGRREEGGRRRRKGGGWRSEEGGERRRIWRAGKGEGDVVYLPKLGIHPFRERRKRFGDNFKTRFLAPKHFFEQIHSQVRS